MIKTNEKITLLRRVGKGMKKDFVRWEFVLFLSLWILGTLFYGRFGRELIGDILGCAGVVVGTYWLTITLYSKICEILGYKKGGN